MFRRSAYWTGARRSTATPLTIFGSSLSLWLDYTLGVSGSPVDTWSDQSGNGNDATQIGSARPTSSSGIVFDGADDRMVVADHSTLDASTQLIIGLCFTPDVVVGARSPLSKSTTTSGAWSTQINATALRWHAGAPGTAFGEVASFVAASTKVRAIVRYDGSLTGDANRLRIYKNGVLQSPTYYGSIPATLTNTANDVVIGSYGDPAQFFDGTLFGVVVVKDYAASDAEITALDGYLATL